MKPLDDQDTSERDLAFHFHFLVAKNHAMIFSDDEIAIFNTKTPNVRFVDLMKGGENLGNVVGKK